MDGTKKVLLGCCVFAVLLILGIAAVTGLDWSEIRSAAAQGSASEELALARELARQFGHQPEVEFECRLPVVEVAPCALLAKERGSREVRLTFSNFERPPGVVADELARRIALAAYQASTFAGRADHAEIVFEEGDESASVARRFAFAVQELAADDQGSRRAMGETAGSGD